MKLWLRRSRPTSKANWVRRLLTCRQGTGRNLNQGSKTPQLVSTFVSIQPIHEYRRSDRLLTGYTPGGV
jgi:hypothetical protein